MVYTSPGGTILEIHKKNEVERTVSIHFRCFAKPKYTGVWQKVVADREYT